MEATRKAIVDAALIAAAGMLISVYSVTEARSHFGRGNDFFVAFPEQEPPASQAAQSIALFLAVFNPTSAPVTYHVIFPKMPLLPTGSGTLAPGSSVTLELDDSLQLEGSGKQGKGVRVKANDTVEVQVTSSLGLFSLISLGKYLALPSPSLSGEYIVATHCRVSKCFIVVVITRNNTVVRLHLRVKDAGVVRYGGGTYGDHDVISDSGDVGDVIQVTCDTCDLSGTLVNASQRVAVLAGGQYTYISPSTKDMVVEQYLPWQTAGQYYALGPDVLFNDSPAFSHSEMVKVITNDIGTRFCHHSVCQTSTELRQTFVFSIYGNQVVTINATAKVLVAVIVENAWKGDQAMFLPLPVDLWSDGGYEIFLGGKFDSNIHLVLIANSSGFAERVRISGDGYWEVARSATSGVEFSVLTVGLRGGLDLLLTIECQAQGASCGSFHGYVYAYSDNKAWSVPLMPDVQITEATDPTTATDEPTTTAATTTLQASRETEQTSLASSPSTTLPIPPNPSPTMITTTTTTTTTTSKNPTLDETITTSSPSLLSSHHHQHPPPLPPPSGKNCSCPCTARNSSTTAAGEDSLPFDLEMWVIRLKKELVLDARQLSRRRRTKISADDSRVSSLSLGMVAIFVMLGVALVFIFSDFQNFVGRDKR